MHIKNRLAKQKNEPAFKDYYGVLQLAANVTMTQGSIFSFGWDMLKNWGRNFLTSANQLPQNNMSTISYFKWMEPTDFIYELYWESRLKEMEEK